VADIHWLVPDIATNVFHPPDEANASCELKLAYMTQDPRIISDKPDKNTYTLLPELKNVKTAPLAFDRILEIFRARVDMFTG
jgi:hypothetical protein